MKDLCPLPLMFLEWLLPYSSDWIARALSSKKLFLKNFLTVPNNIFNKRIEIIFYAVPCLNSIYPAKFVFYGLYNSYMLWNNLFSDSSLKSSQKTT